MITITTKLIEMDEEFRIIDVEDGHPLARIPQYGNREVARELAEKMQNAIEYNNMTTEEQ